MQIIEVANLCLQNFSRQKYANHSRCGFDRYYRPREIDDLDVAWLSLNSEAIRIAIVSAGSIKSNLNEINSGTTNSFRRIFICLLALLRIRDDEIADLKRVDTRFKRGRTSAANTSHIKNDGNLVAPSIEAIDLGQITRRKMGAGY